MAIKAFHGKSHASCRVWAIDEPYSEFYAYQFPVEDERKDQSSIRPYEGARSMCGLGNVAAELKIKGEADSKIRVALSGER